MTKSALWTVVVSAAILVGLIFVVPRMLAGPEQPGDDLPAASVPTRPDCPVRQVGTVELPCLGGQSGSGPARPTVVNVWAWWCGPCRTELPLIDALSRNHPEWNVVGVHADPQAARGAALLTELGVSLPSLQDDRGAFAGGYGLPGVVPMTVVFDANGNLVKTFPTVFHSEGELAAAVTEVLG